MGDQYFLLGNMLTSDQLYLEKKGKTVISPFGGKLVLRKFQFYLNRTQGV